MSGQEPTKISSAYSILYINGYLGTLACLLCLVVKERRAVAVPTRWQGQLAEQFCWV